MSFIPKVLIIAGSDSGGGAGIQADIKAITYFKGYAMTAVTAITAQNTIGVQSIFPLPKEIVIEQINSVTNDLAPDIVKIGMLADEEIINHISTNISDYKIVLDPVIRSRNPLVSLFFVMCRWCLLILGSQENLFEIQFLATKVGVDGRFLVV